MHIIETEKKLGWAVMHVGINNDNLGKTDCVIPLPFFNITIFPAE